MQIKGFKGFLKSQRDGEYCSGGVEPAEKESPIIELRRNGTYFIVHLDKNMCRSYGT